MANAQVLVDAAGRVLVTVPGPVNDAQLAAIRAAFDAWRTQQPAHVLIVPNAEVVRVLDVELQLPEEGS